MGKKNYDVEFNKALKEFRPEWFKIPRPDWFNDKAKVVDIALEAGDLPVVVDGILCEDADFDIGKMMLCYDENKNILNIPRKLSHIVLPMFEIAYNPMMSKSDIRKRKASNPKFDVTKHCGKIAERLVKAEIKKMTDVLIESCCLEVWCIYRTGPKVVIIPTSENCNGVISYGVTGYVEVAICGGTGKSIMNGKANVAGNKNKKQGEKRMSAGYKVGDVVMTKWDDSVKPLRATILDSYRGHRGRAFIVALKDGSEERIKEDQIVRKVKTAV
jgi:hypothetical protein